MDVTFPERYHRAVEYMNSTFGSLEDNTELDNMQKLLFYALGRQASDGPCNEPAPYMWNVKEKYKHDAWKQLQKMNKFEAMVYYVQKLDELRPGWLQSTSPSGVPGPLPQTTDVHHESVEDEWEQYREPTAANVDVLIREIRRLRSAQSGCEAATPSVSACSTSDSMLPAVTYTDVVPPSKPVPSSYADVVPPTKPTATKQLARRPEEPVYYMPKKLTWLEWFGLVNVDDVVEPSP